jgi:hypothetical protein
MFPTSSSLNRKVEQELQINYNAMHLNRMKCTVHTVSSGGSSGGGGGGGGPAAAAAAGPLPLHAYCRPPPSLPASAPAACGLLPPEITEIRIHS